MIKRFNENFEENSLEYIKDNIENGLEDIKNVFVDFTDLGSIDFTTMLGPLSINDIEITSKNHAEYLDANYKLVSVLQVKCEIVLRYKDGGLVIDEIEEILTTIKRLNHLGHIALLTIYESGEDDVTKAVIRVRIKIRK